MSESSPFIGARANLAKALLYAINGGVDEKQGVKVARDALVVHCAASGLKYPPVVPVWSRNAITLQPVRAGFPCFGAAMIGYVEATRGDDEDKNRVCPASSLPDTPASFARMHMLGNRADQASSTEPDIREWANQTTLNPARVPPERLGDLAVAAAFERYRNHAVAGYRRLAEFAEFAHA